MVNDEVKFNGLDLKGINVLIVEDEVSLSKVVGMMFEELGAIVHAVTDGLDAIRAFEKDKKYDIVYMDLRMKNLSGEDAIKRIYDIDPDVKIIASSGLRPSLNLANLIKKYGGCFLEKPFNLDKLESVLSKII